MPRGRQFFYYLDDDHMTTERDKATRFRNIYLARQKLSFVKDHAPAGLDWVRTCPA